MCSLYLKLSKYKLLRPGAGHFIKISTATGEILPLHGIWSGGEGGISCYHGHYSSGFLQEQFWQRAIIEAIGYGYIHKTHRTAYHLKQEKILHAAVLYNAAHEFMVLTHSAGQVNEGNNQHMPVIVHPGHLGAWYSNGDISTIHWSQLTCRHIKAPAGLSFRKQYPNTYEEKYQKKSHLVH